MLAAASAPAFDAAAWRREAAVTRRLADNDLRKAAGEATRLERALPPDAAPADRTVALNLRARIDTYQALTDAAARHASEAHALAEAHGDKVGQAEADLNIALNAINQGRLDDLVQATNEAVRILEGVDRPDLLGEAMLRASVMYRRFEQFEESVSVAVQAMEIARRSGDPLAMTYAHQGLAIAYEQSFRQRESVQHYEHMQEQARRAKSRMLEAFALQGITGQAVRDKEYATAERMSRQAIAMFEEIGAPFAQAFSHYGLGQILQSAGRLPEALAEVDKAQAIYQQYPNRIGLWFVLMARSSMRQAAKDFTAAQVDADRADEIARGLGFAIYTTASANRLAELAAARGDMPRAYALAQQAREQAAQAQRERASRRILELTERYESESGRRQLAELSRRNEMQTAELNQRELQQRWLWTLVVASALVAATTVYFLLRLRRSHGMLHQLNTELARSRDAVSELNSGLEARIEVRTAQFRQQARYLRTLIDTLPLWAYFKDAQQRFLVANQAYANAHRQRAEDLIGHTEEEVLPPDLAAACRSDDEKVLAADRRAITEVLAEHDGERTWLEWFKAPVRDEDGTLLGMVGVARDISAEKATAEAREAALEEARRLAKVRSAFMAQMSHELRTPLNAILGFSEILLNHRPLDDRQARGLTIIQQSGQHLLALINDVLDLAKVDAGKLELVPRETALQPLLTMVVDIVRVKAEEKGLRFELVAPADLPATVEVDPMRLRQVLLNLLSNAVKFTDLGAVSLKVVVPAAPAHGARRRTLRFEVRDTGTGIEPDQLARLFRPFEQAGDAKRRATGTGLGLAISRELVRLMGGELAVHSQPGQGSRFWFDLDLACGPPQDDDAWPVGAVASYEGERRRVLVIDDADSLRLLVAESLTAAGFVVACADDGREGLALAAASNPDLILVDMTMPVMDGLETVHALREREAFKLTPIVMMSAMDRPGTEAACLAAGAQAFFAKPIDMHDLMQAMGRLLGLRWQHRSDVPPSAPPAAPLPVVEAAAHRLV